MRGTRLIIAFSIVLVHGAGAELINRAVSQWFWPSSVAVGDYLYVTGGEHYWPSSNEIDYDVGTYVVDLTEAWNNETIVPVGGREIESPSQMRASRQPLIFYNAMQNTVNRWGGWPYDGDDYPSTLWSFELNSGSVDWKRGANASANASGVVSGPFAAAVAYSNETFFSFGGDVKAKNPEPDMTVLSGLVMQDFSSQTWSNVSFEIYAQTQYRTHARAAFAENFGEAGYLIAVGGENPVTEESVYQTGNAMADMAEITLYDVASGAWYQQKATGEIPPPRSEFCAVGVASRSDTFELFVYGGAVNSSDDANKPDDEGYLNVHVLSLPAFRWFKSSASTTARRACHTCSVIGNRQMISVGGRLVNTQTTLGFEQDPWTSAIGVFDMTELAWKDGYEPEAAAYEMPDLVRQYYSSSYEEPSWADPALASVFRNQVRIESPNSTSPEQNKSSGTPAGAIAGGVVGGVAAIALLGGLLYFWLRRRRRQHVAPTEEPPYPEDSKPAYTDVEPGVTTHEVDGRDHKTVPAELASPDAVFELPGHGRQEGRGNLGMGR